VPAGKAISRSHSMLEHSHPDIELSAFKRDMATSDLIIRLFNHSSESVETTITIDSERGSVCTTNLLEQWSDESSSSFQDHLVPVSLGAHQIITLRIRA
jgi:alpha-mannosidase